jgi:hypothetical protein
MIATLGRTWATFTSLSAYPNHISLLKPLGLGNICNFIAEYFFSKPWYGMGFQMLLFCRIFTTGNQEVTVGNGCLVLFSKQIVVSVASNFLW